MTYKVEVERCARVLLYLPKGTNQEVALCKLIEACGGATEYEAFGSWLNAEGDLVDEPVTVVEGLLSPGGFLDAMALAGRCGEAFLEANEDEQMFLAYVDGHVVKIERNGA